MLESVEIKSCQLCPRLCRADRSGGRVGYCRAGSTVRVFRWGPHNGEEPPISGSRGSGTIFFSHCSLGCLYCQNYPWSAGGQGDDVGIDGLCEIMNELHSSGCHNWNLVTPGPWLPYIEIAAEKVRGGGVDLPFVYNTSGYEVVDVVSEYKDLMDIVLTDLRYSSDETAREASNAPDYIRYAREFVKWCTKEIGPLEIDGNGVAVHGTVVRILVLPGHADEAVKSLEWIADECGTDTSISVMAQYTPVHKALENPGWDRCITKEEYEQVTESVERLGFENGWIQEFGVPPPPDLVGCNMSPGGPSHGI